MKPNIIPFPNLASDCTVETAIVKGLAADSVMIASEQGAFTAVRAFSCLVMPIEGDKVLISRSAQECYVLAVLERLTHKDMSLDFPGDVVMKTAQGGITMTSSDDINLLAARTSRILASETQLTSGEMTVTTNELHAGIGAINGHVKEITLVADAINTIAKNVTQRVDTLIRWVEGVESLSIGHLMQNVRKTFSSHSHEAVITAKTDLRIDGERIHMG